MDLHMIKNFLYNPFSFPPINLPFPSLVHRLNITHSNNSWNISTMAEAYATNLDSKQSYSRDRNEMKCTRYVIMAYIMIYTKCDD
jgi:hypothetical protein